MAGTILRGVAFVAGSASGIGRSTAFAFARVGVKGLVVADINTKALNATVEDIKANVPGVAVVSLHLDIRDEASCTECMIAAFKAFGRIDYAVNNVGIGGSHIPTVQQTTSEFMQVLKINLVGLWTCQREQVRHMLEQIPLDRRSGRGAITNTASILGLVGGPAGASAYVASKHAIVGMTKNEAATYGKEGIRINTVCPGYVSTAILGNNDPEKRAHIEKTVLPLIPMERLGEPEEIADTILFLSSPAASYISGASLAVDGGYTAV